MRLPYNIERALRQGEKVTLTRAAYRVVDQWDRSCCFITGARLQPCSGCSPWKKREHHHIVPRSRAPERIADPTNIITVSAALHQLIQQHYLWLLDAHGEPATTRESIARLEWNRNRVPEGQEPWAIPERWRTT